MFLEMRTYVLKPGMTNNFVERFAEGLTARLQFSKLLGLWQSEVGGLNRVLHTEIRRGTRRSGWVAHARKADGRGAQNARGGEEG